MIFVRISDIGDSLDVRILEIVGTADDGSVRLLSVIVKKSVEICRFDVSEIAGIIKLGPDAAVDKSVAVSNEKEFAESVESVLSPMKTWRKFVEAVDWVSIRVELSAEMEEVKPVVMEVNGNMFEGARELEDTVKNFDSADELEIAEVDDSTSDVKEFIDEAIIELMRIEDLVEDVYDVLEEDKESVVDGCDEVAGNDWVNTEVSVEVSVKVCDSLDVLPTEVGNRVEAVISVLILSDVNV